MELIIVSGNIAENPAAVNSFRSDSSPDLYSDMPENFVFLTRFFEQEKTERAESHMKLSTPPFPSVQIMCFVAARRATLLLAKCRPERLW
jgi:hypothetical protein